MMSVIGRVDSVWRYPVKSMRGEELPEIFAAFAGVYGDRLFAFKSSAAPSGFPYLTGREAHDMLLFRPRFRYPEKAGKPPNLAEAEELSPILNPVAADPGDLALDVETPSGELLAIGDPALLRLLADRIGGGYSLSLLRSERAMTDCRPISSSHCRPRGNWERRSVPFSISGDSGPMCTWISEPPGGSPRMHLLAATCALDPKL